MKDVYDKFAYDYDEFGSIEDYLGDEKSFFESLFREHKVKTVLDCACGTGQHLFMFSEMGLSVSGSDFSEPMLEVADQNLKRLGKTIPLCRCDFRFLEQAHSELFDSVVCLTSALPHLHTDADLLIALKSMKNRLNENGLLVLTQGITHFTLTLPAIQVIVNRNDFSRVFVIERDGHLQTIHAVDLFHSDSRTEINQYEFVRRIILDDEYRVLLSEAGFQRVSFLGDYDKCKYNGESRRLIVVAQS
jgi:ubiquinone/menaquinone biosynthesis C-methylase UbiE